MDVVSSLLDAPRARGAFVIRSELVAPWSISVADRAPLTLVVPVRGRTLLAHGSEHRYELRAGQVAIVRGPEPYCICDDPDSPRQAVIGVGQTCTKPDGSPLSDFRDLGVRAWGNVPRGRPPETVLLTATYQHLHQVSRLVLDHLPTVLVVDPARGDASSTSALVDLLLAEAEVADLAQDAVVDRLVDLVLVTTLRSWLDQLDRLDEAPPWYAGRRDAVVGEALRRIHHEPEGPWSLERLAADVGVSRATLARRFGAEVGEPPMSYLARWRLGLAADLVASTDLPLSAIASRVGYASAYSLSHAFRRTWGTSPSAWRSGARGEAPV